MAVRTNYEIIDIIDATDDYSITATDLNNNMQTIISSENAIKYIKHKFATRFYSVLRGSNFATKDEASDDLSQDYRLWIANRQHNIDKLYQSMFDYDYSPIENVDRYESETTNKDIDTTYGKTSSEGGSDSLIHGKTLTRTGSETDTKSGYDSTTYAGRVDNETMRAGFNSPNSYTPDSMNTETFSNREDRTGYNTTDTHTNNTTDTEGGTDRTTYGKTITDSGSDSVNDDTVRTLRVHGNIGVTSNVQLLTQEEEYRMQSLAEMLIDNFINDYTFYS